MARKRNATHAPRGAAPKSPEKPAHPQVPPPQHQLRGHHRTGDQPQQPARPDRAGPATRRLGEAPIALMLRRKHSARENNLIPGLCGGIPGTELHAQGRTYTQASSPLPNASNTTLRHSAARQQRARIIARGATQGHAGIAGHSRPCPNLSKSTSSAKRGTPRPHG